MPDYVMWIILAVFIVIFIVWMYFSSKKRKKQEEEANKLIDAVKPGNKVKTIGGICGIVVEVDPEEKTFVLETGSETSGKSYIKFDRQAIYQTDAVIEPEKEIPENHEAAEEAKPEETSETADTSEENNLKH